MLDILVGFRKIKPVGAKEDYKAGDVFGETPQQLSIRLTNSVYRAVEAKPDISVKEIVKVTGLTQGGCHGMLSRLVKKGLLTFVKKKVPYANKPASFYTVA